MKTTCSVVSYHNPPDQIAHVLCSIASTPFEVETWLVDNSRTDVLRQVARRCGVHYIHRPDNPGVGTAHNLAIAEALQSGTHYHAVLNPDIRFGPEVIPALRACMESYPDIGMLMPDIRYQDGSRQYLCKLLPHPGELFVRRFAPWLYRWLRWQELYEMRASGYDRMMDVPFLSGCFMFLRASVLDRTGGFDERFFMYMEDVDLSRRVGRQSRTVFYPWVSVTHGYAKGSYRHPLLLSYHVRSAIRYFNKWGWFFDAERSAINRAAQQAPQRPARA